MTRAEEEKPMNREQVEKAARAYLFDAMPANGPAFNFDSVSNYMTNFALAMMEKQRKKDEEMVVTALKEVGGRFEWEGWQAEAIEIVENAFHKKEAGHVVE